MDIDDSAVEALGDERLDWRFKAVPAAAWGLTVRELAAEHRPLTEFGTPLLTLDEGVLAHNLGTMAGWATAARVSLAPHGKTTMAPALWRRQLAAGAWALTLANLPQLRVARAFGVSRVLLANELVDSAALAWAAAEQDRDPGFELYVWADSLPGVALMDQALRAAGAARALKVCVELGGSPGRTGVRDDAEALAVAEAVTRSPTLTLAGLAGYEGALAQDAGPQSLATVDRFLGRMAALHGRMPYETSDPVLTAGGSAYFDQVADVLTGLGARVVVRAGCYLVHDDGFYRGISPFARSSTARAGLRSAMHAWARVVSRPEKDLALLDAGRRDLSFDNGLPEPQGVLGSGSRITALNDQHAFLTGADVEIGDVVRLGLSHPCTALDKWSLIPVLDDGSVVDFVRTFF